MNHFAFIWDLKTREKQDGGNDRGVIHYQFITDIFGRVVLGANVR